MRKKIFEIIEPSEKKNTVQTLIADVAKQDFWDSMNIRAIEDASVLEEGIDFCCGGQEIAPSLQDYGFYCNMYKVNTERKKRNGTFKKSWIL